MCLWSLIIESLKALLLVVVDWPNVAWTGIIQTVPTTIQQQQLFKGDILCTTFNRKLGVSRSVAIIILNKFNEV